MLISIHIPKCAGSSVLNALAQSYRMRLLKDYPWKNVDPAKVDPTVQCIHGHFPAAKYKNFPNARFVTWMRHPVDRLQSHYIYWKYRSKASTPARIKMLDEDWSFERFCMDDWTHNLCHRLMTGATFEFVGLVERIKNDWPIFHNRYIAGGPDVSTAKATLPKTNRAVKPKFAISPELRSKIEQRHDKDMELFHLIKQNRPH